MSKGVHRLRVVKTWSTDQLSRHGGCLATQGRTLLSRRIYRWSRATTIAGERDSWAVTIKFVALPFPLPVSCIRTEPVRYWRKIWAQMRLELGLPYWKKAVFLSQRYIIAQTNARPYRKRPAVSYPRREEGACDVYIADVWSCATCPSKVYTCASL